ncbi:MAG: hypothetical protein K9N34_06885 [Candidatus Marinimicrobia bacterium]|nr:hypothetical protein [Candidatus Neomarinimicrobiota bacterium]MCF7840715.1 hypothetical protein [Candidatus Neomarinimicrobiota bacterium]
MFKELINLFSKDNLMKQAFDASVDMLKTDREMFLEAVRTLRESDTANLRFDLYEKDRQINSYEREVRRKVMTHLAIAGATELAMGIRLVSIVIDIERIGDYTKNIVELAINHTQRLQLGDFEVDVKPVEERLNTNFNTLIQAFVEQDSKLAREVMSTHQKEVSSVCDRIVTGLVRGEVRDLNTQTAAAMVLYLRFIKRIHSHLKNIASSIVNPVDRIGYSE